MKNLRKKEVKKILHSFRDYKISFNEAYEALNLMVKELYPASQIICRNNQVEEGGDARFEGLLSTHYKDFESPPKPTVHKQDDNDYGGLLSREKEF